MKLTTQTAYADKVSGSAKADNNRGISYRKIRFTGPEGATAGIVITDFSQSISDLSRLYPYSEARKMSRFEMSPEYITFLDAFNHTF